MLLRYISVPLLLTCALPAAACAKPAVHRAVSMDFLPPSIASSSVTTMSSPVNGNMQTAPSFGWHSTSRVTITMIGKTGDARRTRSSVIPGTACDFRRRVTQMVGVRSNSRQIVQMRRNAGGTAASEPTMHQRKRAERFISARKPLLMSHSDTPPAP